MVVFAELVCSSVTVSDMENSRVPVPGDGDCDTVSDTMPRDSSMEGLSEYV